ncbi:hypothetical protein K2173_021942 [Erythroxylum novogranatense]|uniref:Uncharacterized protein n=1 Tax=Erythroxylum novogranatense TaxID=1862640 RepID=A0AAV8T441_9ROSI|nr:hypothetical protein K2173_021942 [Erythroxylum novogranatense]
MQEAKKKISGGNEDSKKKERHIVAWTPQEDDILREQIKLHGTENWSIIASEFKDKTTRQCRRRWYTYLNSDFRRGGWSPEEDMLLCEAQKVFGNRWTEIAKVVSGRTDNAVKNRFSTLSKKRAKCEALAKENKSTFISPNNERIIFHNGFNTDATAENRDAAKKLRSHVPEHTESFEFKDRSHLQGGNQQPRSPFAVLAQNIHDINVPGQPDVDNASEVSVNAQSCKTQGTFLKKDDPKIAALMQQAELLSSLALKVCAENTDKNLENAWKILQDYLNQSKENDCSRHSICDGSFQFDDFKDLIEDLRSINDENQPSWRQPDLYEASPASSEYSTGSNLTSCTVPNKTEDARTEIGLLHKDIETELPSILNEEQNRGREYEKGSVCRTNITQVEIFPSCDEQMKNDILDSVSSSMEFSSPIHVTPLFRSLAATIPSPKFSESERNFLLKTLGMESPRANQCQAPPCKRALLESL